VRDGREGVLYDSNDSGGAALSHAIEQAARPEIRGTLGASARSRAVEHFSWRRHCEQLDNAIRKVRAGRPISRTCAS
jgi:glycosyltransferase involved in cell wall biosynthesis